MLTNYVKAIRYLQGIEKNGEPFTIRDWMRGVREDRPNGWLFISSMLTPMPPEAGYLDVAVDCHPRPRRWARTVTGVWIFADELPTLHKLPDWSKSSRRRVNLVVVMCSVFSLMPSWKTSMALSLPPRSLT
uniref:Coupling protein TraD n=1 Tax=Klebsiella pneumoniae TaxID=573 RepID=A0A2P1BN57_KLEPN|nr:Coupling protein TraD [Klebsiella pneumoniae]